MPGPARRFYAVSISIYLLGVAVLAGLAFFGRGSTERIGEATVRVRYRALPLFGTAVEWALLSWQGLKLTFDQAHALTSGDEALRLESVHTVTDGVDLVFEGDRRLQLRRGGEDSWSLAFAGATGIWSLQVPWRLRGSTSAEDAALSWQRGGAGFLLTLPSGSRVDAEARVLEIAFGAGGRELRLVSTGTIGGEFSSRWLSDTAVLVDEATWNTAVGTFRAAAWRGWTRDRLAADGSLPYADDLGAAVLAEALARGVYLSYRSMVADGLARRLSEEPEGGWTLAASPYVGRMAEYARRLAAREAAFSERIRSLLAARDPGLLADSGLVPFALDHAAFDLARSLAIFAGSLRLSDLRPATACGALEILLDYLEFAGEVEGWEARCREIVQRRLLATIVRTDAGLFLAQSPGQVDVALSISAGALLQRASVPLSDERLSAVGRTLVASAVGLARADGFLPAVLRLSGNEIAAREGDLAPETVYARVGGGRFVPRETPLHLPVGPGAWLWSAARLVAVEAASDDVRLRIAFPAGSPHHLLVAGLKPFRELQLHGMTWRPDPGYAQYSDGWTWDEARQLLYLKLTGRQDEEEIIIRY